MGLGVVYTPSVRTLSQPFDLSLKYLSLMLLCGLLHIGIYNQCMMLCTFNSEMSPLQVFMGLKGRSPVLQKVSLETWGRGQGTKDRFSLGQSEVPLEMKP